jgi:MFS family permease
VLPTWPALIAPVIAPLAGGFITTYASWHWLFLINLPLGVIAFAVAVAVTSGALSSMAIGAVPFLLPLLPRRHRARRHRPAGRARVVHAVNGDPGSAAQLDCDSWCRPWMART